MKRTKRRYQVIRGRKDVEGKGEASRYSVEEELGGENPITWSAKEQTGGSLQSEVP